MGMKPSEAPRRNTEDPKTQGSLCLCIKEGGNRKKGWFQVTKNRFQQGSQWAHQMKERETKRLLFVVECVCVCVCVAYIEENNKATKEILRDIEIEICTTIQEDNLALGIESFFLRPHPLNPILRALVL